MSGGPQALMRTRCPDCGTVFRVTSEQLRRKAGKVRCGHCQVIFNAFDHWQAESHESAAEVSVPEAVDLLADDQPAVDQTTFDRPAAEASGRESPGQIDEWIAEAPLETADTPEDWVPESETSLDPEALIVADVELEPEPMPTEGRAPESVPEPVPSSDETLREQALETPEESTLAAREAGLVASRELTEAAAYSRWAAGTLAADGLGGFAGEPVRPAVWPYVLVAGLLSIALLGQLLHFFRTDVVLRIPDAATLYELVGVDIPLSRNPAQVSIETSDLQSDNARGLFVLQATLKNGAGYPQAWPALELSLTDTSDTVVSRRVIYAAEYLPPGTTSDAFPANAEIAVKLWIEARDVGAVGYRLYIFYP